MKLFRSCLIILALMIIIPVVTFFCYRYIFYESELRSIRRQLNAIEGVEVVNIWGHKDVTLEEISARIKVGGNGEMVLANLSEDEFRYPEQVILISIGGFAFKSFHCPRTGLGSMIDIGTGSWLGRELGLTFESPEDVIAKYDSILSYVRGLQQYPEVNHFVEEDHEWFLFVKEARTSDRDPIHELHGADKFLIVGHRLPWNGKNCFSHYITAADTLVQ